MSERWEESDILDDLKSWHVQLVADAPHRRAELPEVEIKYVNRAIEEIERLRAALAVPPQRFQQQAFDGPAASHAASNKRNDEHAKRNR